jgi:hypothetical protein
MKRFYSKFKILLMTFVFGLASVFVWNGSLTKENKIFVQLPQTESDSVFYINTKRNWQGFEVVGHGCGGRNIYGGEGSGTGYQNASFERVSVNYSGYDNPQDLKREINLRIKDSVNILANTESKDFKKKHIILERMWDDEKRIDIITFESPKLMKIVSSKSLELTNDFLNWEKSKNSQSKSR